MENSYWPSFHCVLLGSTDLNNTHFQQNHISISPDTALQPQAIETKLQLNLNSLPNTDVGFPQLSPIISIEEFDGTLRTLTGSTPLYTNIVNTGIHPHDWKVQFFKVFLNKIRICFLHFQNPLKSLSETILESNCHQLDEVLCSNLQKSGIV